MSDTWQHQAEDIFLEAVEMDPAARAGFLAARCGEDAKLRRLVEDLLGADEAAGQGNFLESRFIAGADLAQESPEPTQPFAHRVSQEGTSEGPSRFRIVSRYEQGGLGEILIAHDTQLDRDVAVKQIRPMWLEHDEAKARFIQEAEVTGRLEHPGVVPVYAMGTWSDGRPFYAMRFIQGKTLKKVIAEYRETWDACDRATRARQLRSLLNRFIDVCNTIEYAHSRQVLHRDIKPSNIMVGPYGETIVVDWGLAKLLDAPYDQSMTAGFIVDDASESGSGRTRIGGAVGTPQYMSPEQASGEHDAIGVRTDVYLLGATLYQILTGIAPHNESSVEKLIERIKSGTLTRPREVDPTISRPLEAICLKAMSAHSSDRYSSASALAADVERWLADEPVSIYRDPSSVRLGRWVRKHRTLAMSGAVAAVLITVGSVVGSWSWSYQRSKQLRVEQQSSIKDIQLRTTQARRLDEIRDSAEAAWELSQREIEANRFAAALGILDTAADSLAGQPSLAKRRDEIVARAERLRKLGEFYRQAEFSEQYNVMSRDTQGIMAATAALKSLGIWEHRDWWAHLPSDDLTPEQRDLLRWDVYQQWLMLDGMLVKTIGTRLFGTKQDGGGSLIAAAGRLGSDAGKQEAKVAMVVSDRIDEFRQAESARWYRGIARFRLGVGSKVKAIDMETPRNAADAQKLGVMCLISAMDSSFRVVFHDYKNQDPITAGRDLFQRSASLRPNHYWTQLALAQMQYFIAKQEPQPTWESFQPAVQTMGRCIAINPNSCFALADRASLFRFQSEFVKADTSLSEEFRRERSAELLKWSLQDAQAAYRLGSDQPWVGWAYGMSLGAAQQSDQAVEVLMEASLRTFPLMQIADSALIGADDLRGRVDAAEFAAQLVEQHPGDPNYHTLYASIRLNQQRYKDALTHVNLAIELPNPPAHAYAVRGMLRLEQDEIAEAIEDFGKELSLDPEHLWATYGLASCKDEQAAYPVALAGFEASMPLATTDEHRSACALGMGRVLAHLGEYDRALSAFVLAQQLQPACDLFTAITPLLHRFKRLRSESGETEELAKFRSLLQSIGQLPRVTKIELAESSEAPSSEAQSFVAPILNGDFELGAMRYWSDATGAAWRNSKGYLASAQVSRGQAHGGDYSLHIVGDAIDLGADEPSERRGSTGQSFPVPANLTCRLSMWCKARGLQANALRLEIGDEAKLNLPPGDYGWRRLQMEFAVGDAPDPSLTVVPIDLELVSSGAGEVWLDDIEVTVLGK